MIVRWSLVLVLLVATGALAAPFKGGDRVKREAEDDGGHAVGEPEPESEPESEPEPEVKPEAEPESEPESSSSEDHSAHDHAAHVDQMKAALRAAQKGLEHGETLSGEPLAAMDPSARIQMIQPQLTKEEMKKAENAKEGDSAVPESESAPESEVDKDTVVVDSSCLDASDIPACMKCRKMYGNIPACAQNPTEMLGGGGMEKEGLMKMIHEVDDAVAGEMDEGSGDGEGSGEEGSGHMMMAEGSGDAEQAFPVPEDLSDITHLPKMDMMDMPPAKTEGAENAKEMGDAASDENGTGEAASSEEETSSEGENGNEMAAMMSADEVPAAPAPEGAALTQGEMLMVEPAKFLFGEDEDNSTENEEGEMASGETPSDSSEESSDETEEMADTPNDASEKMMDTASHGEMPEESGESSESDEAADDKPLEGQALAASSVEEPVPEPKGAPEPEGSSEPTDDSHEMGDAHPHKMDGAQDNMKPEPVPEGEPQPEAEPEKAAVEASASAEQTGKVPDVFLSSA